jgi:hypothetical protein
MEKAAPAAPHRRIDRAASGTYFGGNATRRGGAVTDPIKTCANCGHAQMTGDFCEKCGTRVSVAAAAAGGAVGAAAMGAAPNYTAAPGPASPSYGGRPPYGTPPPGSPQYGYSQGGRGFWSRFFDFSFEEFITPSLVKALFIIAMVVIGLGVLAGIIMGFVSSGVYGIFVLIAALIGGFIYLLLARVFLEMIVIFFRIRDNTEEIANKKR